MRREPMTQRARTKRRAPFEMVLAVACAGGVIASVAMGCSRESEAAPAARRSPEAAAPEPSPAQQGAQVAAPSRVDGKTYRLEAALEGECKVGATCVVAVRLDALGGFHINKEYPYKFKAEARRRLRGTDAAGKNVFSKGAGDFKIDNETRATMRIRFKPEAKGNVTVSGTYKMSVCSAKECQLESQELSAVVAAK